MDIEHTIKMTVLIHTYGYDYAKQIPVMCWRKVVRSFLRLFGNQSWLNYVGKQRLIVLKYCGTLRFLLDAEECIMTSKAQLICYCLSYVV
jgi:hypothetical protein